MTLNEQDIGTACTTEQAHRMIAALRQQGYSVEYGDSDDTQDENGGFELDAISDTDWNRALQQI